MRLLHTSDWHLGHTLHDMPRDYEHARFLDWLTDTLERESIDALLITGDIFDSANPPAAAQARWYGFLAGIRQRMPALDVVVIAGNHDSAARLEAPVPLLQALRIHVIGAVHRQPSPRACGAAGNAGAGAGHKTGCGTGRARKRPLVIDRLVVPLHDRYGRVAAQLAAVPFLRSADLMPLTAGPTGDPLIEGVRQVYAQVVGAARKRCQTEQALLAAGHCYMVGTDLSNLSERRVLGGNQHALPADIFADDIAYVALGHLHKAQRVGGQERIRYAGSPLPLAMNEARYRHQVFVVVLDGADLAEVRSIPVPRTVDIVRIPRHGAAPLPDILAQINALAPGPGPTGQSAARQAPRQAPDAPSAAPSAPRPYLEIAVSLPQPQARLRQEIETALADKYPRLVKLSLHYTGSGAALAEVATGLNLRDLDPRDVFRRRYERDHEQEPPPELIEAFDELLDQVWCERHPKHGGMA